MFHRFLSAMCLLPVLLVLCRPVSAPAQQAAPIPSAPISEKNLRNSTEGAEGEPEGEDESPEEEARSPFEDKIDTDRDAFTPALSTAPANRWIMESSYSLAWFKPG
jgi:hypothetical protein